MPDSPTSITPFIGALAAVAGIFIKVLSGRNARINDLETKYDMLSREIRDYHAACEADKHALRSEIIGLKARITDVSDRVNSITGESNEV